MSVPIYALKNDNIINKEIIYDKTDNVIFDNPSICKNVISFVGEYSLNKCIDVITKKYPDVDFYSIVYDREGNKVAFYTDKDISVSFYVDEIRRENYNLTMHLNSSQTYDEVNKIINSKRNMDPYCVSIDMVSKLIDKYNKSFISTVKSYEFFYSNLLRTEAYDTHLMDIIIGVHGVTIDSRFDGKIKFVYGTRGFSKLVFAEENGEIKLVEKAGHVFVGEAEDIMAGKEIKDLFKVFNNHRKIVKDIQTGKVVDSDLLVSISGRGINISNPCAMYSSLNINLIKNNNIDIECDTPELTKLVGSNLDAILKKAYVNIDNCPEWSREILFEKRQKELKRIKAMNNIKNPKLIKVALPFLDKEDKKLK